MVIFDQLRISDDGTKMYINIHVNEADEFASVYLDEMYICTADGVNETAFCDPEQYEPIYHWKALEADNLKEAMEKVKDMMAKPFPSNELMPRKIYYDVISPSAT